MERKIYLTGIVFFISLLLNVSEAQHKEKVYSAYVSGDMTTWGKILLELEAKEKSTNLDSEEIKEMLNYQYGYLGWAISQKRSSEIKKYLEKGKKNITLLETTLQNKSLATSYRSAFYAYEISQNKIKAVTLGRKIVESAKLALSQDSNEPMAHIQYANCMFYMPEAFGGSKTKAKEHYIKALELKSRLPGQGQQDWNLISLVVQLYIVSKELKDEAGKSKYKKLLLEYEPNLKWINNLENEK